MNPIVSKRRAWVCVTAGLLILSSLLAVSCATGRPSEVPAPSPVVIEKEVVRTVVVEVEKTVVQEAPAPPPVVVERDIVRTVVVEVERPVVQEVTKIFEVVVTPTPLPPDPTPTPHPDTRVVMDDTGRELEIPFSPKRVAVTNSWMVEVLMSCDYTPVARPQIPLEFVFPPEAHDIPVVAVSHSAGPKHRAACGRQT